MFWHSSYGFYARSITEVAHNLSEILHIEWEARDSDSWGDYYRYPPFNAADNRLPLERFNLYWNHNPAGLLDWKNWTFRQCPVLLDVTSERPLDIDARLFGQMAGQVILLERQLLDNYPPKRAAH